jgi:uncharacterized protein (DUF2249 family)
MAKSDSPIIHLDELDSLDIISDFHPLIISKTVKTEITKHRPKALQRPEIVFKLKRRKNNEHFTGIEKSGYGTDAGGNGA